jgi:sulfoxide reductase heme-binding subunit YedZ
MKRYFPWILLNIPSAVMLIGLLIHPNLCKSILSYAGWTALSLLIFLLLLNPYIKILPLKFPVITKWTRFCNQFRSELGVSAFIYACLHLSCFIIKRGSIKAALPFFLHPALIPGWVSLLIFVPLAITSNKYFMKKLGFAAWKKLHTKVYIAEWLLVIHLYLTKHTYIMLTFIPLMIFQYFRRRERAAQTRGKAA